VGIGRKRFNSRKSQSVYLPTSRVMKQTIVIIKIKVTQKRRRFYYEELQKLYSSQNIV
jgi:hypothetical protein